MVRRDGYSKPEKWRHTGKKLAGNQTRRFKLVSVGYCRSLNEVRRKLKAHGGIPEGQWRESLKAAYRPDDKGHVGVADSSWVDPLGGVCFPYVGSGGYSYFDGSGHGFHGDWRWLVEVSK
jgi:hypothetical protein